MSRMRNKNNKKALKDSQDTSGVILVGLLSSPDLCGIVMSVTSYLRHDKGKETGRDPQERVSYLQTIPANVFHTIAQRLFGK